MVNYFLHVFLKYWGDISDSVTSMSNDAFKGNIVIVAIDKRVRVSIGNIETLLHNRRCCYTLCHISTGVVGTTPATSLISMLSILLDI